MPTQELNIFQYPHNLRNRVKHIRQFPDKPILSQNKDIGNYVEAVFDGVEPHDVYVRHYTRPVEGSGAHFDVYNHTGAQLLHEDFPFIATYNTWGESKLRATALSVLLKKDYDAKFLEQKQKAHKARRHLGNYALNDPTATIYTHSGTLGNGSGIVIPQIPEGPYVVHEVSVANRRRPIIPTNIAGAFLKFLVPADNEEARSTLISLGFKPFEGYEERFQKLQPQVLEPTPYPFDDDDFDEEEAPRGISNTDHIRLDR